MARVMEKFEGGFGEEGGWVAGFGPVLDEELGGTDGVVGGGDDCTGGMVGVWWKIRRRRCCRRNCKREFRPRS